MFVQTVLRRQLETQPINERVFSGFALRETALNAHKRLLKTHVFKAQENCDEFARLLKGCVLLNRAGGLDAQLYQKLNYIKITMNLPDFDLQ